MRRRGDCHLTARWVAGNGQRALQHCISRASPRAGPRGPAPLGPVRVPGAGLICLTLHPAAPLGGHPDTPSFGHIHVPGTPPPSFSPPILRGCSNEEIYPSRTKPGRFPQPECPCMTLFDPSFICKYVWAIPPNLMNRELFTRSSLSLHILLQTGFCSLQRPHRLSPRVPEPRLSTRCSLNFYRSSQFPSQPPERIQAPIKKGDPKSVIAAEAPRTHPGVWYPEDAAQPRSPKPGHSPHVLPGNGGCPHVPASLAASSALATGLIAHGKPEETNVG